MLHILYKYCFKFLASIFLNDEKSMQLSTTLTEGVTASLTCIATGRPAPTITWHYTSTIRGSVSNISVGSPLITVTSVLTIQNPSQALQNQTITCFASHPFTSTMNRTTFIHIHCKLFCYHTASIACPSSICAPLYNMHQKFEANTE